MKLILTHAEAAMLYSSAIDILSQMEEGIPKLNDKAVTLTVNETHVTVEVNEAEFSELITASGKMTSLIVKVLKILNVFHLTFQPMFVEQDKALTDAVGKVLVAQPIKP